MTNAYFRRRAIRLEKNHEYRNALATQKLVEIDHICKNYEDAFFDLYQVKCKVNHSHGWYWICNVSARVRQTQLVQMTQDLYAKKHESDMWIN